MTGPVHVKLGKLPARHDPRTLMLAKYLKDSLPPPPPRVNWGAKVKSWPMYRNDAIGDCTCAAAGHMVEAWTAAAQGKTVTVTERSVVSAYTAVSGYDPKNGRNDDGAVELDVLKYWRRTGIGKHKIAGFVAVESKNHPHIRSAVHLFGGAYIGLELPISAQGQTLWTVPPGGPTGHGAPGSWGGHAVNVVAYDSQGLTVITWGAPLRMTWTFWDAYCTEAYAVLSKDFVAKATKKAPVGFGFDELIRDLSAL